MVRYDPDGATVVGVWNAEGVSNVPVGTTAPLDGETAAARVYRTRAPARIESYEEVGGALAERLRTLGFRSAVAAPIFLRGGLWGAVIVSVHRPEAVPGRLRAADRRLRRARRPGAGQRPGARGARRLAGAHHAGRGRGAPAAGAQPARRRAAAAGLARAAVADGRAPASQRQRPGARRRGAHLRAAGAARARARHPPRRADRARPGAGRARAGRPRAAARRAVRVLRRAAARSRRGRRLLRRGRGADQRRQVRAGERGLRGPRARERPRADRGARRRRRRRGAGPGTGLRGLADRVEALGGWLEIDSPAGAGTTLRAKIPVR